MAVRVRVDDAATCAATWLRERSARHADEALRAAQIAQPLRRAQFQAGRQLAAQLLARHAGGAAADWVISSAPGEKPRVLSGPAATLPTLSLAHRGPHVCCVVADVDVGIDIEQTGRLSEGSDAYRDFVLSPAERVSHDLLPTAQSRSADLLARWVLKEAWAKRDGRGLDLGDMPHLHAQPVASGGNTRLWWHGDQVLALCADELDEALRLDAWPGVPAPTAWQVAALPTLSARRAETAAIAFRID